MRTYYFLLLMLWGFTAGCDRSPEDASLPYPSFAEDLAFLREHGDVTVLEAPNGGRIALSAAYQGRVMTSGIAQNAPSLGWINRDFISSGSTGTAFDNYGGLDRFWLGPEGGQHALYFPPDNAMNLENWQVPAGLQDGKWREASMTDTSVTYQAGIHLSNYGATAFDVTVERTIALMDLSEVNRALDVDVPAALDWIAFSSSNRLVNTGVEPWSADDGLLSIWILGMLNTFGTSWVVIRIDGPPSDSVVTDDYFGEVPSDRLDVRDGYVLFKADGEYRSKIGIPPQFAMPLMGSYSPQTGVLTIIHFDLPPDAGEQRYVNSLREEMQVNPYGGDVVNAYNDGPPGAGGFYELESSSPALSLSPGGEYTHHHRTMQFSGDRSALDSLATAVLGIGLDAIEAGI